MKGIQSIVAWVLFLALTLLACAPGPVPVAAPPKPATTSAAPLAPGATPIPPASVASTATLPPATQGANPDGAVGGTATPLPSVVVAGRVREISANGRVITFAEPVEGFTSITLTENTQIVSEAGLARKVQDIKPGMVVEATGTPGGSGSVTSTRVMILNTPPSLSAPSGWNLADFPDLGVRLLLPDRWSVVHRQAFYLAGPGLDEASIDSNAWCQIGSVQGLPQSLTDLMQKLTQRTTEAGIVEFSATRMLVGGFDGVAIRWTDPTPRDKSRPARTLDLYVPAYGQVHQLSFRSPLLDADGKSLTATGRGILDSVRFYR